MYSIRLLSFIAFLALALSVFASPLLQERATSKCTARDVAIVRRTIEDETYFCKWWLSDIRTRSPFLEFTQTQVTDLCKCITSASNAAAKPKREEQAIYHPVEKRATQVSCLAEVSVQFTEPNHFCTFYNAYPRTSSPFAKYSAQQLLKLCNCAIAKPTSSLPFCSSQSTIFAEKPTQLSQALNYCSSLLRPTVSGVKTVTQTLTLSKTQTQSTSVATRVSSIKLLATVSKIQTQQVVKSVTAESIATETSDIIEYVETTNLGTVSVATNTETTASTVTVAAVDEIPAIPTTSEQASTIFIRRDALALASVPSAWVNLLPAQATQACSCILKSASLKPTTVYLSTQTILKSASKISTVQAQSTRVISVTLISTINKVSTLRSTITSTVSTALQTQTVLATLKATLTTSIDTVSTSLAQELSLSTYTCPSLASVTPTVTVHSTSLSTLVETSTTTVRSVTRITSAYTITTTSYTTASSCTIDGDIMVQRRQGLPTLVSGVPALPSASTTVISNQPTVFSTVSICPPTSTATSTVTSTDVALVTSTTVQTAVQTVTARVIPIDDDYATETVTSTITPACTTSTVFVTITEV